MKVLIAIVVAVLLFDCIDLPSFHVFDMHLSFSNSLFGWIAEGILAGIISIFVFAIVFVVLFSVLGSLALACIVGAIALLVAGLSVFWPLVLFIAIIAFAGKRNTAAES